jgi:hypothetical protein
MAINTDDVAVKDKINTEWIRQALFVPERKGHSESNTRASEMRYSQQFSYSSLCFADTSIGGNRSINPRPQFTKGADHNLPSLLARECNDGNPTKESTMGMGRYYAEAIDSNASRIFLQFGVPVHNSLGNFYTTFYDPMHGNMANSGTVGGGLLSSVAKFIGYITVWALVPELAILSLMYGTAKKAYRDWRHQPLSKYYYMKSAMPLYWTTVTTIVNALSVNMKLSQGFEAGELKREANEGSQYKATPKQNATVMVELSKILPDIMMNDEGGIDIRMVASRYQRLADAHERAWYKIRSEVDTEEKAAQMIKAYIEGGRYDLNDTKKMKDYLSDYLQTAGKGRHLIDKMIDTAESNTKVTDSTKVADDIVSKGMAAVSDAAESAIIGTQALWTGIMEHLSDYAKVAQAEARDGSAFISYIVDWESTVRESFSNRTRESDVASKMNETSRSARGKLFDIGNGNIADNIVADSLESIVSLVGEVVGGFGSALGLSGLSILGGKAFVDIPEYWDSSSTNFPSSDYSIQLRSPYGNPISILTNVLIPLATLIAGAAPRSAGRNSYTGPFLCKLWQQGRCQIQLGMITELSITRGVGNVGWNVNKQPLAIDVSFTVTNLSKLLHVPITGELSIEDLLGLTIFDEDTNFTDYMAILGSLTLVEQYYADSRWRLRNAKVKQGIKTFFTIDHFLQWGLGEGQPGSIISVFARKGQLDI